MKKFFALAGAIALCAACSDDDNESIDYSNLTKKWYNVSEKANGETYPYDDHEVCGKDYVEFMTDGTGSFVDVWDCDPGVVSDEFEFDWARSGKTVTVSTGSVSQEVTIQKLTGTTLEIKVVYDHDDDGDDEPVIETYTSNPN